MGKVKISVIMGIYNVEPTLEEALDSLLEQTYQDFEIVLCDDGSVDNTYQIAKNYRDKYPDKIVLLKNDKNMGLNYTLNNCLDYCSGEYIARMDGDDVSVKTRFEKQVSFLDENPQYAFVSTTMVLFDEHGEFRTTKSIECPIAEDCIKGSPFCHAPSMIRHEVFKKVNGYTNAKWAIRVEDVDLWIKLYASDYKGYNISEPLYRMRDNRDAILRRKFRYRVNSTIVRIIGCKKLNLSLKYYFYSMRPIIVGLIPRPIYVFLHTRKTD